jgi:hypothetical protein
MGEIALAGSCAILAGAIKGIRGVGVDLSYNVSI